MTEDILTLPPDFKLYKDRAIFVGTFMGGPLVAGYLAAENFKRLGEKTGARTAWVIAIIATIIIFGAIFLIPDINKVPRLIIPLAYTAFAQMLVGKYQGAAIKKHIADGGQTYSVWRAVWVGLIGLAILAAILFAILWIANPDSPVLSSQ